MHQISTVVAVGFAAFASIAALAKNDPSEKPSYSAEGRNISFHNAPNRDPLPLNGNEPTVVAKVEVTLATTSDIFVNFTSGIAADSGAGCPCSVRAALQIDDQEPIVVKRINVGAPAVQSVNKYEHDRQPLDGSYVFTAPPGKHSISLIYVQVDGKSKLLEAYYPNLQSLIFPR